MKELLRSTTAYRAILAEAKRGEHSHASLVVFPDGVYLRPLLRECAKAFFFGDERREELIGEEHFSDCLFYPAADGKLTADDCAEIVEESTLRPVEGAEKLFVLDRFHTASAIVQNKLLKLLEEPPEGVHFLLGAEAEFAVLPTVLSRVKKYAEPPFPEEAVRAALGRMYPVRDGGAVTAAAAACGGIYSVAEALLSGGGEEFALAEEFLTTDEPEKFCRKTGERGTKREFFAALTLLLRDVLFCALGESGYAVLKESGAGKIAREFPAGAAVAALERVAEAEKQIGFNANFASCLLELAMGIREEKIKWQKLS